MSRRSKGWMLLVAAGLLLVSAVACEKPRRTGAWRPQVVIILAIDTLRADHLSCFGYGRPTSPFIDRFGREGVIFDRAFSQANYTLASFSSLLTGLYPKTVRDSGYRLPPEVPTLASTLKSYGFRTAAFVGGAHLNHQFGLDRGFDTYQDPIDFGSFYHTAPPAMAWLEGVARSTAPAFLFVHTYDVHEPYRKPMGFESLYDPGYEGIARTIVRSQGTLSSIFDNAFYEQHYRKTQAALDAGRSVPPVAAPELPEHGGPATPLSPADMRHVVASYDGAISYADAFVGLMRQRIDELGLTDRTLVVLLGDHGEELFERGVANHKIFLNDTELHVPLIFWGPGGLGTGVRVGEPVELLDVMPTILDMVGIRSRPGPGVSRSAALRAPTAPLRSPSPTASSGEASEEPVAVSVVEGLQSIRTARYRLVERSNDGPSRGGPEMTMEKFMRRKGLGLFDVTRDPLERVNLDGSPGMESVRWRLHLRIEERLKRGTL